MSEKYDKIFSEQKDSNPVAIGLDFTGYNSRAHLYVQLLSYGFRIKYLEEFEDEYIEYLKDNPSLNVESGATLEQKTKITAIRAILKISMQLCDCEPGYLSTQKARECPIIRIPKKDYRTVRNKLIDAGYIKPSLKDKIHRNLMKG